MALFQWSSEQREEAFKLAKLKNSYLDRDIFIGKRYDDEMFWVRLQPFLLRYGYKLRPRYQPDWTPSWFKLSSLEPAIKNVYDFEDALPLARSKLMDATRQHDGAKVVMKIVDTSAEEIQIIRYLTSPELLRDPRNRTVPLLDVLHLPDNDSQALIVMPQLLQFDRLPFRRVGEIFEAIYQYLQASALLMNGLEFMHEHHISHRDASYFNLMMDASKIVPRGFHYFHETTHDGLNREFEWLQRWSVRPVQYYFIDFDISHRYLTSKDVKEMSRLGQDKSVPEYLRPGPYDPFKADIYQLGNTLLKTIKKYNPKGLESLLALGEAMTSSIPEDRPSPAAALQSLDEIDRKLLERRIWKPTESWRNRLMIRFNRMNPII
ncbi:hypothetical protein D9615_006642 [Tricholomella constricta]|uniref:Protein kinase domain-containing protein n=1 Tax=Tricholomella constricta TaxID=117010 RepID=A0A8H5M3D2_9AGAR|nr:hypothetical protein D9615_006642 [Tricholomella constricta]